jgi:hypothetical protein
MYERVPNFLKTEGQISQKQFHILQISERFKEYNFKVNLQEQEKRLFTFRTPHSVGNISVHCVNAFILSPV